MLPDNKKALRVLILTPGLPLNLNNIRGGVHSAVSNLLKGFADFDVDVRVVSFSREVQTDTRIPVTERIEVYQVYEGPYPYHSMNYLLRGPRILRRHIRDFAPDIIHFQEGSSFMFTRIKGVGKIRFLQTIHGMAFSEAKRKKKIKDKLTWYFNGVLQTSMMPRNVIHLSKFSVNLFSGQKINKGAIIPNAIVKSYFNVPLKTTMNNSLLYIGVIDNNKNLIFLLGAMKTLRDMGKPYTLNVLGDYLSDVYKQLIITFVKENNLQDFVYFQGWVPQSVVLQFIESADILVVCSKHESLPMVIAESMAAGKVVVASNVGGIPEMIKDGVSGYLYSLSEPEKLVNILANLHDNFSKVQEIAANAKVEAQRYDCHNVAEKTIEFYESCLQEPTNA